MVNSFEIVVNFLFILGYGFIPRSGKSLLLFLLGNVHVPIDSDGVQGGKDDQAIDLYCGEHCSKEERIDDNLVNVGQKAVHLQFGGFLIFQCCELRGLPENHKQPGTAHEDPGGRVKVSSEGK